MDIDLNVRIERQPDYTTCGPTSLHALYSYYGDPIDLDTVIKETPKLPGGGTLGVHLAVHALSRGYEAAASVIGVSEVNVAATDLDLSVPVVETPRTLRLAVEALAFVLLMLLGAGAALWVFRDDVRRTVVQWERVPPTPSAPRIPQSVPLRVPSVPVSALPRTRPADDNRPAFPAI